MTFKPPKDIKQWWCAPHCGPGTLDTSKECGFCGANVLDCAKQLSEAVKEHPEWNFDGIVNGNEHDDPDSICGGSGFWCSGCGRFWAQNSCGESGTFEHHAADGVELELRDGKIYCVCGKWLMTKRPYTVTKED